MNRYAFFYQMLFVVLLFFPTFCLGKNVTICYENKRNAPFVFSPNDAEHDPKGLAINIIRSAAKKANLPIQFISRPWLRCQQMVKNNQAQALFAMIKTPERTPLFKFPTNKDHALMTADYGLFIKKDGILDNKDTLADITSVDNRLDVRKYKKYLKFGLSGPIGYVVNDILLKQKILSNFEYTVNTGLVAVAENRLDGYVISKMVGLNKINEHGLSNSIYWSNIILTSNEWYIPFNNEYYQQHEKQIEKFWFEIGHVKTKEIERYFSEFD